MAEEILKPRLISYQRIKELYEKEPYDLERITPFPSSGELFRGHDPTFPERIHKQTSPIYDRSAELREATETVLAQIRAYQGALIAYENLDTFYDSPKNQISKAYARLRAALEQFVPVLASVRPNSPDAFFANLFIDEAIRNLEGKIAVFDVVPIGYTFPYASPNIFNRAKQTLL